MYGGFMESIQAVLGDEAGQALRLFEELHRLRAVWGSFQPAPPLSRSDLLIVSHVMMLARETKAPVSVSALARAMHHSKPGVSQKVRALEEKGVLERYGDPRDGRRTYVRVTEEGRSLADGNMRAFLLRIQGTMASLGPEKIDTLLNLLSQLNDAILNNKDEELKGS